MYAALLSVASPKIFPDERAFEELYTQDLAQLPDDLRQHVRILDAKDGASDLAPGDGVCSVAAGRSARRGALVQATPLRWPFGRQC
jgi:hypothetical protein